MEKVAFADLAPARRELVLAAVEVRKRAYAPYSRYLVGTAIRDGEGRVHTGCNVEGAEYSLTTHAEVSAINSMIKAGSQRLAEVAVVVKSEVGWAMPCGLCRQKIREFAGRQDVAVIGVNLDAAEEIRDVYVSTLEELLPYSFGPEFL